MVLVRVFTALVIGFSSALSLGCTSFYWKSNEGSFLGKNYDWHHDQAFLLTNKRGVRKTGFTLRPWEAGPQWVSRYGSITFNQYGREFPNGGMNEEGLVVEVLWLEGSEYEGFDFRPVLNQLTWVQYQLDNFALVSEVMEALPKYRLSPIQGKIHYFLCDKTSNCAVIEWLHGKPVVHSGVQMDPKAIANSSYAQSVAELERNRRLSEMFFTHIPVSNQSISRFIRVANLMKLETPNLENSFYLLDSVKLQDLTTWRIVYNIDTRQIFYRTKVNPELRSVELGSFDYTCSTPTLMLDVHEGRGAVDKQFRLFDYQKNLTTLSDSVSDVNFSWILAPYLNRYPMTTSCENP